MKRNILVNSIFTIRLYYIILRLGKGLNYAKPVYNFHINQYINTAVAFGIISCNTV